LCYSIFIILMILGHPNLITRYFSSSYLLVSAGKYSFGIYLWHLTANYLLRNLQLKSELIDVFFNDFFKFCLWVFVFCILEDPLMKFASYLCRQVDKYSFDDEKCFYRQTSYKIQNSLNV